MDDDTPKTKTLVSRTALLSCSSLLLLDVATKLLFAQPEWVGEEYFAQPHSSLAFELVVFRSLPLVIALLWSQELRARVPHTVLSWAFGALFVAPLGGLFEWGYFEHHTSFFIPFLNQPVPGDIAECSTVVASLALCGASLFPSRTNDRDGSAAIND